MGNLTKNFYVKEFSCKCGCGLNIIQRETVVRSQMYRDAIGSPAISTSGTRCKKHNLLEGGAENSLHLCGWADDMEFPYTTIQNVYYNAYKLWLTLPYGGLIFYDWGIHQDIGVHRFIDKREDNKEVAYV